VLRQPLEHFIAAYALTHLLLDQRYVSLVELRLAGASVVERSGDYLPVELAAGR
jgi:hypothetical protein